jgi:hypothetical protein
LTICIFDNLKCQDKDLTPFGFLVKGEQESSLFELPKEYEKYDNLVELTTEGRMGSRLDKPKDRRRPFEKPQH